MVRFPGRVLYLTRDAELLRRQLAGEDLAWDSNAPAHALRDEISTDEITPASGSIETGCTMVSVILSAPAKKFGRVLRAATQ